MKTVLINFSDKKYRKAQKLNSWTGKRIAKFDKVLEYGPDDIDEQFRKIHSNILEKKRGCGLWLWKPYFICKTLESLEYGDILFYCDSGAMFVRKMVSYIKNMNDDIYIAKLPLLEKQFTKKECIQEILGANIDTVEENQYLATYLGVRKTDKTCKLMQEWLQVCCEVEKIDGQLFDKDKQDTCYISHREDQSILSLLCKKNHITPSIDISQYGKYPEMYGYDENFILRMKGYEICNCPCIILYKDSKVPLLQIVKLYIYIIVPKRIGDFFVKKRVFAKCEK